MSQVYILKTHICFITIITDEYFSVQVIPSINVIRGKLVTEIARISHLDGHHGCKTCYINHIPVSALCRINQTVRKLDGINATPMTHHAMYGHFAPFSFLFAPCSLLFFCSLTISFAPCFNCTIFSCSLLHFAIFGAPCYLINPNAVQK